MGHPGRSIHSVGRIRTDLGKQITMFQAIPAGNGQSIQLFCIAHAGAGPSAFRGWAQELRPEIEAILIQLPGREGRFRDPAYVAMEPLVQDLTAAIVPHLNGIQGFSFFGNSMGGLIGFETIREIKRRTGREAMHLFVSAAGAPHLPPPLPPMAGLPDDDLVREVCLRYDGIPEAVLADKEFLALVLSTLRADIRVFETHFRSAHLRGAPEPIDCPITAFGGRRDRTVPIDHIEGWRNCTRAAFNLLLLDEGHLYLQSARKLLTKTIRGSLLKTCCVV
jgi:medium-chain acyl-[acyl-carrier-protein] hydrolase